jgi:hypothetical protein
MSLDDLQSILNIGFSVGAAVGGWFGREMWAAVKELKADLAKLREELPQNYVPKDDFRDGIREIKDMLTRIFDRLDAKADK